jgi:hypothetical protein
MKWRLSQGGNEAIYEVGLHGEWHILSKRLADMRRRRIRHRSHPS